MKNIKYAILILIIFLGSFLRFYKIDKNSLWNDELASWERSNHNSLKDVISDARSDVHPPGNQILLFFVIKYIGDSEFLLRSPSAIAGIISIFLIYLIGKKLYSEWEGIISSALLAILWFPIYYSQEARVYSLLLLFSMLSFYLWIIVIERLKNGKMRFLPSFFLVLSSSITCYLHYFGLLFVVLQGTGTFLLFFGKKKKILPFLLLYSTIFILYIPWLPVMIEHLKKEEIWIKKEWVFPTISFLYHFFNNSKVLISMVLILYLINPIRNLLRNLKERRLKIESSFQTSLLLLWLFLPFIITFTKSLISTPVITIRNLIISLPPAYLLLARSVTQLKIKEKFKILTIVFLVSFSTYHLFFVIKYYSKPQKEQFREAVYFVAENYALFPDSLIIGYAWSKEHLNYYFKKKGFEKGVDFILGEKEDIQKFEEIIKEKRADYVWFIRAHRIPHIEFMEFIKRNFLLLVHSRFFGCDVYLFKNVSEKGVNTQTFIKEM